MLKANTPDDRKFNYDIKYLQKVFAEVDGKISVPDSLLARNLRPLLDKVPDNGGGKPGIMDIVGQSLRTRVFSLQSAVSYALAFVVIVAVAYALGYNTPDIVDGSIAIDTVEQESNQAVAVPPVSEAPRAVESQVIPSISASSSSEVSVPSGDKISSGAPASGGNSALSSDPVESGVGGGGEAVYIDKDSRYNYFIRFNDENDPDKSAVPITIEAIDPQTELCAVQIDIPDIQSALFSFVADSVVGVVGESANGVAVRAYTVTDDDAIAEYTYLAQPGKYEQARIYEGVLHTLTVGDISLLGDIQPQRLPDSDSDLACIITAVNLESGLHSEIAYVGIDPDKDISLHNRNIYIPYVGTPEDGEAELYMAQIKLDGIDFEMVLVP